MCLRARSSNESPRKRGGVCGFVCEDRCRHAAFLFPILLKDIGTATLLYILVGTSLLGAVVTRRFRIETRGVSLEALDSEFAEAPPSPPAEEARRPPLPQPSGN